MSRVMESSYLLRKTGKRQRLFKNLVYLVLALPVIVWLFLFHYLPMGGIVLAFKDYNFRDGIFGSAWCGFKNFEYLFSSSELFRVIRNTVGYSLISLILLNLIGGMVVALLLYEIRSRLCNKVYQTAMLIPNYISWIAISYIALLFLNPESGIINQFLEKMGIAGISWYNEPVYWPFILIIFQLWKAVGMASLYYYAALLSIDPSLYEAASIDGAGKFKQIWHISVPEMMPMACIVLIGQLGSIMSVSFDMFYQLPMNSGALYPATDVLETYIYRNMIGGSIGPTAAVGLFQSVVGLILILMSNSLIKRISPDNAMF